MNLNTKIASELLKLAKELSVPEKHQKAIAIKTLKMNDVMARMMGDMSKDEAREFLRSIGYDDRQIRKLEASEKETDMNRMQIASELVKLAEELSPKQKEYREHFKDKLEEHDIEHPGELESDEAKKDFFEDVGKDWESEEEGGGGKKGSMVASTLLKLAKALLG